MSCPTEDVFVAEIKDQFPIGKAEEAKLRKLYGKMKVYKDEIDKELLLGDDAMKDYKKKPVKVATRDVTDEINKWANGPITMRINGSKATMKGTLVKATYGNGEVTLKFANKQFTFATGQDRSKDTKGNGRVKYVEVDGLKDVTNTLFDLGNKESKSNWDNLEKQEDYVHGDIDSMVSMLKDLHEMGGKKATEQDLAYYEKLLRAMDSKFFNKAALYLKKTTQASEGRATTRKLEFKINSKNEMLAGNQQTEAEIYMHEIIHTMTAFARRSDTPEARALERELEYTMNMFKEKVKWQNFLPKESINKELEEANAKQMYDYIFTSNNAMDEFIAHVLTNPIVKKLAENTRIKEPKGTKSILEKVMDIFNTMVNLVLGNYKFKERNSTVYDQVYNLSMQLAEINTKAEQVKLNNMNLAKSAMDMVNRVDSVAAKGLNAIKDKWLTDNSRLENYPKDASRGTKAKWLLSFMKKAVINKEYGKALGLIMSSYHIKPNGILRNVLRDVRESSDYDKAVEWLQLQSDKIEGQRNSIITAGKKTVLDGFTKKLNKAEERALLRAVIDTDLNILFAHKGETVRESHFTMPEIRRLMTDKEYLSKQIRRTTHRLEVAGGKKYFNWYKIQAMGLGKYLATGKASIAQNFNAVNIARGLISTHYRKPDPTVIREVDVLATLVAIENTAEHDRMMVADMMKNQRNGVVNLMAMHKGYNKEAKEKLFDGNSTQMIKGYSKDIYDDRLEMKTAPLADRKEMEEMGYDFKGKLKGSFNDKAGEEMALYVSKSYGRAEWLRATTRLTGMGSKGTTITQTKYADGGDFAQERAARDIRKLDLERLKIVQKMLNGTYTSTEDNFGVAPLLDPNGDVVNYRYMMSKKLKEDILKQDTSVSEVIGRTYGAMEDKRLSDAHNKEVLKSILDNMKENWDHGVLGKDGLTEYTVIRKDSTDPYVKELYSMLPKTFREAIKKRSDKSIAVPTYLLHNYFGYRHMSLTNIPGLKRYAPKLVVEAIGFIEAFWQELAKIATTNILLKIPRVLFSNIRSNLAQAINEGTDPITLVKYYIASFRDVRAHIKKYRELAALEVKMTAGTATKQDREKIYMLSKQVKNNPVHELMDAGMYQAFQEDVNAADLRSRNKVKRAVDEKIANLPSFIKIPLQWAYLSEETGVYKFMQETLQISDLIARDVMNRQFKQEEQEQAHGKKPLPDWYAVPRGLDPKAKLNSKQRNAFLKEARAHNLYVILQAFINYNKASSRIEAYLNKVMLFKFTNFVKRIQIVNARMALEHPIKTLGIILTKAFVMDFPSIQDQSLVSKISNNGLFGNGGLIPIYNPVDTLENVITPALIKPDTYKVF